MSLNERKKLSGLCQTWLSPAGIKVCGSVLRFHLSAQQEEEEGRGGCESELQRQVLEITRRPPSPPGETSTEQACSVPSQRLHLRRVAAEESPQMIYSVSSP